VIPHFEPASNPFDGDDTETPESYAAQTCACKEPDVWMEISEGDLVWGCDGCKKPMSDWFTESVLMNPIKVSYTVEPGCCTCNMLDQFSCDCDQWPVVKPVIGEG
jgi:hypothetical protein